MGKLELWGPLGRFLKPSAWGALMGSCPLLQERRLKGWMSVAQSHRASWSLGLGKGRGML